MNRAKAKELYQKYQSHRARMTPADAEIAAIYKRIARGDKVIRALESIKAAGLNGDQFPRLAIGRADLPRIYCHRSSTQVCFSHKRYFSFGWRSDQHRSKNVLLSWEVPRKDQVGEAIVPLIPVHLRPKRGIENYFILWEAEWSRTYPVDPYLLRRFGGDAWLVVAAWDLTEAERAVMGSRIRN
jgi:hypothetical protein